jgi:hypothetical protein
VSDICDSDDYVRFSRNHLGASVALCIFQAADFHQFTPIHQVPATLADVSTLRSGLSQGEARDVGPPDTVQLRLFQDRDVGVCVLLREVHPAHKVLEAGVGTETVHPEISPQKVGEVGGSLLVSFF